MSLGYTRPNNQIFYLFYILFTRLLDIAKNLISSGIVFFLEYGPPEQGEYETKPTTLKNALISKYFVGKEIFTPTYGNNHYFPTAVLTFESGSKQISKRLPLTMEVQKLKVLIHRLFGLHSSDLTFFSYNPKVVCCSLYIVKKLYIFNSE